MKPIFLTAVLVCPMGALAQSTLPTGPGRDALMKVCSACHGPENVVGMAKNKEDWGALVSDMATQGAQGTDQEFKLIVDYLAANFPDKINVNKATDQLLETVLDFSRKEAEAVIHSRDQNGNFKSLADLAKVPGMDAKKIEARKDRIEF
jgi:competence protein ComEA